MTENQILFHLHSFLLALILTTIIVIANILVDKYYYNKKSKDQTPIPKCIGCKFNCKDHCSSHILCYDGERWEKSE